LKPQTLKPLNLQTINERIFQMANYWQKQPSSRPIVFQALAYTGNATSVPSTNFSAQTYQVRICSEVQGCRA
jgi:hypothetical protein